MGHFNLGYIYKRLTVLPLSQQSLSFPLFKITIYSSHALQKKIMYILSNKWYFGAKSSKTEQLWQKIFNRSWFCVIIESNKNVENNHFEYP
jgi:hypothetical protein